MDETVHPVCPHCGQKMRKMALPDGSTWTSDFLWVCFNDECPYFVRGWDWMLEQNQVHASYRHRLDPDTGQSGPLAVWSYKALKNYIIG